MKIDASSLWFTAAELGTMLVEYGDVASSGGGLDWGVARLDQTIIPSRAGQLTFLVARPGGGKTTISAIRARRAAKKLVERGEQDKKCVVVITLDQAVEEVFAMMTARSFTVTDLAWGRVEHDKLVQHSLGTTDLPIRMIGKSAVRRSNVQLTFDEIFAALDDIYKVHKVTPAHVMLDYIQIARTSHASKLSKAEQVSEAVLKAADLSFAYGCTIDICVQASREVDKNTIKLPSLADCQWSSGIEQEGYKVISIWRPILTEGEGAIIKVAGKEFRVEQNLLIMKLLKQKMDAAGYIYALRLDPARVELNDWERVEL